MYNCCSCRALAKFYSAIGKDALERVTGKEAAAGTGSVFRSGWGEFLRPTIVKHDSNDAFAAEVQDEVMFQGGSGQFALGYTMFPANATTAGESNKESDTKEVSQERVTAMAKRFNVSEDEVRAYMSRKRGTTATPASPPATSNGATSTPASTFSSPIKSNKDISSSSSSSKSLSSQTVDNSSNDVTSATDSGKKKTTLFHRTVRRLFKGASDNGDTGTSSSCVPTAEALNAVVTSPQLIRKAILTMSGKETTNLDENKHGTNTNEWVTFGHGGVGGSIALCSIRPDGKTIAIAVTLNRLSFDPSNTSGRLVAHVYKKFGISIPNNFR